MSDLKKNLKLISNSNRRKNNSKFDEIAHLKMSQISLTPHIQKID